MSDYYISKVCNILSCIISIGVTIRVLYCTFKAILILEGWRGMIYSNMEKMVPGLNCEVIFLVTLKNMKMW